MKKLVLLLSIGLISVAGLATPTKKKAAVAKAPAVIAAPAPVVSAAAPGTTVSTPAHKTSPFVFEENKSELFLSATQAEINSGSGFSNINISGMYTYLIQNQIQVGAELSLGSSSYGSYSSTQTGIFALGMYNFQPTINESVFAFAGLGVASTPSRDGSSSSNKVGLKIGAGKRFPLWAKIQFVPTLSIEKLGEFDPTIKIVPVNFSLIF